MEAIGQLTAGVTHHFNMMLQGIIGNLDLAAADAPDALRPFLDDAAYDADCAAGLVRQLVLFYRQEQRDHTAIDLGILMEEVVLMCRGIFPRWITVELEVTSELPTISGNHGQLRQCLANLCANARDAVSTPEHATTEEHTIRLRAVVLPHGAHATSDTAGDEETQNSPLVRVDVVDDGVGIEGQLFDDRDAETVGTEPLPATRVDAVPGLPTWASSGEVKRMMPRRLRVRASRSSEPPFSRSQ